MLCYCLLILLSDVSSATVQVGRTKM